MCGKCGLWKPSTPYKRANDGPPKQQQPAHGDEEHNMREGEAKYRQVLVRVRLEFYGTVTLHRQMNLATSRMRCTIYVANL